MTKEAAGITDISYKKNIRADLSLARGGRIGTK
jgi:hypothetical protein